MLNSHYLTPRQKIVNIALLPSSWVMLLVLRVLVVLNQWSADRISQLVGESEELPEIEDDLF